MKIDTKIMEEFLTKIRMDEVETCLLDFSEEGLKVSVMSIANTHKVDAILHKKAFKEYEPIGKIGVDELSKLIKVFKRLGKELEFSVEGNLLVAKANKKELKFELVDEKFIEATKPTPEMEHSTSFKVDGKIMNECLTDAQMSKDVAFKIETVDGGVKISNTGKYRFSRNIDSEGTKGGEVVKFGEPLYKILKEIKEGEIVFEIKTDFPILATTKTDLYEMTFLAAPRVENS